MTSETKQGHHWKDSDTKDYKIIKKPEDPPDDIKDVPDNGSKF